MSAPVDVLAVEITCTACGKHDRVTFYQANVKKCLRCHACQAAYAVSRRMQRKAAGTAYKRNHEQAARYERERSQKPEVRARRAADMRRYVRDPLLRLRHEARWQVRHAIAAGKLVRQPCEVCEKESAQGHHDDYSKPLDVRWLCSVHHREHHARISGAK